MLEQKLSGILAHPTSFSGAESIGTLDSSADDLIDKLNESGSGLWQVLPLGHTGYGDSPYQTFSRLSGSPLMIPLTQLRQMGVINQEGNYMSKLSDFLQVSKNQGFPADAAQFGWNYYQKIGASWEQSQELQDISILRTAYDSFMTLDDKNPVRIEFETYKQQEADWLDDYAEFMALKETLGPEKTWQYWGEFRDVHAWRKAWANEKERITDEHPLLEKTIDFYKYTQFVFWKRWDQIKEKAGFNNVQIIGDMPFYPGLDSAHVWANPELFELDEHGNQTFVAGVPPDAYSEDGQRWGNPIYKWWLPDDKGGYELNQAVVDHFVNLVAKTLERVDILRIDHFRAIDTYCMIPVEDDHGRNGFWELGPGEAVIQAIVDRVGEGRLIAEDLGWLDPYYPNRDDYPDRADDPDELRKCTVGDVLTHYLAQEDHEFVTRGKRTDEQGKVHYDSRAGTDHLLELGGIPNMIVLEWDFEGPNMPDLSYIGNGSVVYPNIHDLPSIGLWLETPLELHDDGDVWRHRENLETYFTEMIPQREKGLANGSDSWIMTQIAWNSDGIYAITPLETALDKSVRMNTPGTLGGNWEWRMSPEDNYTAIFPRMKDLNIKYDRTVKI